jgi:hypothetical protein
LTRRSPSEFLPFGDIDGWVGLYAFLMLAKRVCNSSATVPTSFLLTFRLRMEPRDARSAP